MNPNFLDFEQPIAELEDKLRGLTAAGHDNAIDVDDEVGKLRSKLRIKTAEIFRDLTPWQVTQLSRHPGRPYTNDYVAVICDEFHELAGDRMYSDDAAIVGGLARIIGRPVMVIGHQKGRDIKSKVRRNFGMPRPEGYRKALRLMQMAERFGLPILTFIDTPGAYPGVGAEERGQSEAIARNLEVMAELKVPIVCTVIGEGGSGGALAIGVGDRVNMLQYSTYSVISPEGCASILWKNAGRAKDAAEALGLTAPRLKELGLIDKIIREPTGGAHRNPRSMAIRLKAVLLNQLDELQALTVDTLSAFSSRGPTRIGGFKPDIAAPGQVVTAALGKGSEFASDPRLTARLHPSGCYVTIQGTSMATPFVAGLVALLLEQEPTLTPADVQQRLRTTARRDASTGPVWNPRYGWGKLDAATILSR